MKKAVFFLGLIAATACTQADNNAQASTTASTEKIVPEIPGKVQTQPKPNIENIPTFEILSKDSVKLNNSFLQKNKGLMIIYFSPDCSHCQHLMQEMKPEMSKFKKLQILMVSFVPTERLIMLRNFYRDYGLKEYPNITLSTDYPKYPVQKYYQVQSTPYIAVYNRQGKLVSAFEKIPTMTDLETAAKKAS